MKFFSRFWHALCGVAHCIQTEQNFRIHITAACTVLIFSAFYGLSASDYPVLLLTIALVLSLEAVNTAIERAVDLAAENPHPLAKTAKDAAAGSVLVAAVGALAIAFFLFRDTDKLFAAVGALFTLPWLPLTLVYLALCVWFIWGKK